MNKDTIAIIEYRDKALQTLQTLGELSEHAMKLVEEDKIGSDGICLLLARQTRNNIMNTMDYILMMLHYAAVANNNGEDLNMFHEQNRNKILI